jgi:hypothetical protein
MNLRTACLGSALLVACSAVALPAHAQTTTVATNTAPGTADAASAGRTRSVQTLRAVSLDSDLRIDGRLEEAAWSAAEVARDFVQQRPTAGEPATERTEARILYTRDAVYVGMRMYDAAPDSITTQLARRDATGLTSDWAHVLIDSYHDRRTAFRFSVNPSGVKRDVMHYDDTSEDSGWDAVWEVATAVDSLGWTAEFRIPLSQLRYQAMESDAETVWGINFIRDIARRDERSWWAAVPPNAGGLVSLFGELHGLRGLPSLRRIEIMPYSVGRLTRAPDAGTNNPFYSSNALWGSVGGDLRYGITSNLTLTATANPDFGQVEADPSQVNLSAFETFLQERRPFFQEGANIFQFGVGMGEGNGEQLFYSRRIGRAPQRGVYVQGGYVDTPETSPILAAAKLSGKVGNGWSVGVLNATTGAVHAQVDSLGLRRDEPVEPLTNYAVARVTRDFRGGQSTFGGIFTATNRRLEDEPLQFLNTAAYAGGVDLRHRFGGGDYRLNASLLGSHIEGSERAILRAQRSPARYLQRPDADHLELDPTRTSLQGTAASLELLKLSGGHWRWGSGVSARTPGFEVNDLGFQQAADQIQHGGFIGYDQFKAQGPFRNWGLFVNGWHGWTFGGERIALGGNINGNYQLKNLWSGYGGVNRNQSTLSVTALRGGPAIVRPGRTNFWTGINSDRRKPVSFNAHVDGSFEDETEGGHLGFSAGMSYRPASHVSLSLSPMVSMATAAWQCATPPSCRAGDRYLFARLDQRTVALTARLNYTFTPNLSLQFYAQPFLSSGEYSEFMEVKDQRAARFADRFQRYAPEQIRYDAEEHSYAVRLTAGQAEPDFTFGNPNFNFRQLRSNAVLRWEYRPGSTLFLVWSQGRTGFDSDGSFRFRHDATELFNAEPTNVFLIKLNYWLNL